MRTQQLVVKRIYDSDPEARKYLNLKTVYLLWIRDMYNDSNGLKNGKNIEVINGKRRSNNSGFNNSPA